MPSLTSDETFWFRVGYALERARRLAPALPGPAAGDGPDEDRELPSESDARLRALLVAGAGTLASRILKLWPGRRVPGVVSLTCAGISGVGAALLLELLRPLTDSEAPAAALDEELAEALLSGAGRGLLYGGVVEPRLPGPPILRGAVYGVTEYMVSPWGGLTRILGPASPHRRLPLVSDLVEPSEEGSRTFVDHLLFGVTLALLYGALPLKRGTRNEE